MKTSGMYKVVIALVIMFIFGTRLNAQEVLKFKVHYMSDSISLTQYSLTWITQQLDLLPVQNEITKVKLYGYTDSVGRDEGNQELAVKRGAFVKEILVGHGVESNKISVHGIGESNYIATNKTREGRLLNRRTVIEIHHQAKSETVEIVDVDTMIHRDTVYRKDTIHQYVLDTLDSVTLETFLQEEGATQVRYSSYSKQIGRVIPKKDEDVQTLVISDWTRSMYPYGANVFKWHLNNLETSSISHMMFFNDGDDMHWEDKYKNKGEVGGMYYGEADSIEQVIHLMDSVSQKGTGGDYPENVIEALYDAENYYSSVDSIVFIADNRACIRDIDMLEKLGKPVHILLNEVDTVNPVLNHHYVNLAAWTGGSIAVLDGNVNGLKFEDDRTNVIYPKDTTIYMPKVRGNLKKVHSALGEYKKEHRRRSIAPIMKYGSKRVPTNKNYEINVEGKRYNVGLPECRRWDENIRDHLTCKPTYTFVQKSRITGRAIVRVTVVVCVGIVAVPAYIIYSPIRWISGGGKKKKGKGKSKSKSCSSKPKGPKLQ